MISAAVTMLGITSLISLRFCGSFCQTYKVRHRTEIFNYQVWIQHRDSVLILPSSLLTRPQPARFNTPLDPEATTSSADLFATILAHNSKSKTLKDPSTFLGQCCRFHCPLNLEKKIKGYGQSDFIHI